MDARKLLRLPEVLNLTANKRSTHYFRIKEGLMVPPIKLGERSSAYPADEVTAIVSAHIAGDSLDQIRDLVAQLIKARNEAV